MIERIKRSWPENRNDQRKIAVLITLGLCALALWIRAWVLPGPATAVGANLEDQPNVLREMSQQIERVYDQLQKREVILPTPPDQVRDVFTLSPDLVPQSKQPTHVVQLPPKLDPSHVETEEEVARRERRELVRSIQEEVSQFRLRSTVVGRTTAAVIEVVRNRNSRPVVLLPGQKIQGFMLLEVSSNSVLLEKQGIVLELHVEQPVIQQ